MASSVVRGLHAQLVDEVGAAIAGGEIQPGERLDVEGLEKVHGVSRTVVREAVRVLATKGMVDARPRRGTFVLERELWNMLDTDVLHWVYGGQPETQFLASLDEVRHIVEPAGARLAATRRTDEDLVAMRQALQAMHDADTDVDAAVTADVHFHRTLAAAAHNDMLGHLEALLLVGLRTRDVLTMRVRFDSDLPSHTAVVDAIEAQDPDAAEAAMHRLLQRAAQLDEETITSR